MDRGKTASVRDVLHLAARYRAAAIKLGEAPAKPNQLPQRLLALHAIELYLDALLLSKSIGRETIRVFQHDLGERARIAAAAGLVLRKRTLAHLVALTAVKEYCVVRYAPELTPRLSQVNRVMATLDELSQKVPKMVKADQGRPWEGA
ncbi:hypothetical protein HT585_31035 [Ensifer sp. HO-A22]|jgi:hypothetical protein|uniref:HEPN domain-containing protein n=1 Tax=Ensifer oleiphilus TaxID=2742698 RepID=A0A7Y6URG3_9HYPH|nr:hypothetical protein [Ensifer oleiphilus]NVD43307.1 hypothetical protein [Ensifer oleiphilus]